MKQNNILFYILIPIFLTCIILFLKFNYNIFECYSNFNNNFKTILKNKINSKYHNLKEYPNVKIDNYNNILKNNKFLPECCYYYSQYSSSSGCPCITPEQQEYLLRRGNNNYKDFKNYNTNNLHYNLSNIFKNENQNKNKNFDKHNIYFLRDPELLSDNSINKMYDLLNIQTR